MCPLSLDPPPTLCSFSNVCSHLQNMSQNLPFQLDHPQVGTGVPNGLLMLWNSFNDFVFNHRSGCCTTTVCGYTGYVGDIES